MNDEEFIERFEAATLPNAGFHHRDHIRVAWLYLRRYPAIEALAKFSESLKHFAASNGKPNLYHETITWAYVLLIHERIQRNGREQSWAQFVESNSDLFDWKNSILKAYYLDATLRTEFARRVFVLPDRCFEERVSAA